MDDAISRLQTDFSATSPTFNVPTEANPTPTLVARLPGGYTIPSQVFEAIVAKLFIGPLPPLQ